MKSFFFLSLDNNYKTMKNKAALHSIHIARAQRSKHVDLA